MTDHAASTAITPPIEFKTTGIAYLFWFFFGAFGGHKFYLGKTGLGVAYVCTLGFLGVGLVIDLFTLPKQVREANALIAHAANSAQSQMQPTAA